MVPNWLSATNDDPENTGTGTLGEHVGDSGPTSAIPRFSYVAWFLQKVIHSRRTLILPLILTRTQG